MDTPTIVNSDRSKTVEIPAMLDYFSSEHSPNKMSDSLRQALTMRVSTVLQTTLDMAELVELFAQQAKPAVPFEGMSFASNDRDLFTQVGQTGEYNYSYQLVAHNEKLGELKLSRKWELSAEESQIFEYLLCSLVYPLRNALRYHQALTAALKDPLTGVYNRANLEDTLQRECRLSHRYDRPLALIVMDIDHFKAINDTFGHASGDCAIRAVAQQTNEVIRSTDILYRYGGEEFVVLLNNTDLGGATLLAERIRKNIEEMRCKCSQGNSLRMTISLGVAELARDEESSDFFNRADRALYAAKKTGRNCVRTTDN